MSSKSKGKLTPEKKHKLKLVGEMKQRAKAVKDAPKGPSILKFPGLDESAVMLELCERLGIGVGVENPTAQNAADAIVAAFNDLKIGAQLGKEEHVGLTQLGTLFSLVRGGEEEARDWAKRIADSYIGRVKDMQVHVQHARDMIELCQLHCPDDKRDALKELEKDHEERS